MTSGLRAALVVSGLVHAVVLMVPLATGDRDTPPPSGPLKVLLVRADAAPHTAPATPQVQAPSASPPVDVPSRPQGPMPATVSAAPEILAQSRHRERPVVRKRSRPSSKAPVKAAAPVIDPPPVAALSSPAPAPRTTDGLAAAHAPSGTQDASSGDDAETPANATLVPPLFGLAYLNNPKPAYPLSARRRGIEGHVLLRVRVSVEGHPLFTGVEHSSGHSVLDRAALAAVRQWRFVPARRGGEAVEAFALVPVRFSLHG